MQENSLIERIPIPADLSLEIERLFFEHTARLRVSGWLMQQPNIRKDLLQEYLHEAERQFIELEIYKSEVVKMYPSQNGYDYYLFDFDNHEIKYCKEECLLHG